MRCWKLCGILSLVVATGWVNRQVSAFQHPVGSPVGIREFTSPPHADLGEGTMSCEGGGHQAMRTEVEAAELVYHAVRMLSPSDGRFLQRDPLEYVDGSHLYQYLTSAPVRFRDSAGTRTVADWGAVSAFAHWQVGDGETVWIAGKAFESAVKGIPEMQSEMREIRDLARAKACHAACPTEFAFEGKIDPMTMPSEGNVFSRWGGFGTIYHTYKAKCVLAPQGSEKKLSCTFEIYGYDHYHSFATTIPGARHVFIFLAAVGGSIARGEGHWPTPYDIYWQYDVPLDEVLRCE